VPLDARVSTQSHGGRPQAAGSLLVHDNGGGLGRHRCDCVRRRREAGSSSEVPGRGELWALIGCGGVGVFVTLVVAWRRPSMWVAPDSATPPRSALGSGDEKDGGDIGTASLTTCTI